MSKYSGMTNEDAADQYADDCGKSEDREAYIELVVGQDMQDLLEFGTTFEHGRCATKNTFNELVDMADDTFAGRWMYENFSPRQNDLECKGRIYDAYLKDALDLIEKYLYEQYKDAIK